MGVGKYICGAALIITGYIIASASGEIVNCQNASFPASGWAESSHIGESWIACLNLSNYPEQSQSIQRLSIYRRSLDDFVQCSKLGKSWHKTTGSILNKRVYELSCPSETNGEMCVTVFNGSKDDLGSWNLAFNDQTGEAVEICSLPLTFEYPRPVKSECSDCKNGEIIYMCTGILILSVLLLAIGTIACYKYKTYNKSTEHAKNAISDKAGTEEETLNLVPIPDQDRISSLGNERQHTLPEQSGQWQDAKNAISDKAGTKEETLNLVSIPDQDEISSFGIERRHTPPEQSGQWQDAVNEKLVYGTESKLENPPVETYNSENQDSVVDTR